MIITHNIAGIETSVHSTSIDLSAITPPPLVGIGSSLDVVDSGMLVHRDSQGTYCNVHEDHLEFMASARKYDKAGTIFYLAELVAEQKRQLHGGAIIHAAGVYLPDGDRGLLILGEKGAGKTSTAIGLCVSHGGQLIGNDQVILSRRDLSLDLIDGTKDIHIRRTAALQDPVLDSIVGETGNDHIPNWDNKTTIDPVSAGIEIASSTHRTTDIVQVVIDRTLEKTIVKRGLKDTQTLLFLAEKISRHIRGVTTPLIDNNGEFDGFSPSLDTRETAANRRKLVSTMLRELGVTKVYAPSTEHVLEAIVNRHE